ncbi:MAG: methylenetetrahydrofolate reductase [Paracoccaceae bacterium]
MALFDKPGHTAPHVGALQSFLRDYSIEVMPRTAAKIEDFRALLPAGTRVYVAHIDGTRIDDMVTTARRLRLEGFSVMPHFPARIIRDKATLRDWIARYRGEADIDQALLLAGGLNRAQGAFRSSMDLIETGLFDEFKTLHFAGHPEGNKDIDPDGSGRNLDAALSWKQEFADRCDARVALVTQFCFESAPVIDWVNGLKTRGIDLPVHIGIAGPARLQTLIKFSIACGVGPSLRVLQRRAKDVTKLLLPINPTDVLSELAAHKAAHPEFNITNVHFFPLGGIKTNATWAIEHGGSSAIPAAAA